MRTILTFKGQIVWLTASPSVSMKCCYIVYIAGGYSNSCLFVNTQRPHQTMYTQANKYDGNELVSEIQFFLQIQRLNRQIHM